MIICKNHCAKAYSRVFHCTPVVAGIVSLVRNGLTLRCQFVWRKFNLVPWCIRDMRSCGVMFAVSFVFSDLLVVSLSVIKYER